MKYLNKFTLGAVAITGGIILAMTHYTTSFASTGSKTEYDAPVSLELKFAYHIEMDMAEQDVFIERVENSGKVYRVTKGDRDMKAQLYRTATPVHHNPFDPKAVGPFEKGEPLGLTLQQWLAGEGKGTYSCVDGKGRIDVKFEKMVPDSVYTMWHFFMAMPPTQPFIGTHDLPIGSRDGAQSVFKTNSSGNAHFQRTFTPCLQLTGEHLAAGLAVAWHSDGKTYGPLPGEFATNSHVQTFLLLPKRSGI